MLKAFTITLFIAWIITLLFALVIIQEQDRKLKLFIRIENTNIELNPLDAKTIEDLCNIEGVDC